MSSKLYNINSEYLEQLITTFSRSIVGKLMKRCEILENRESLKSEIKELVYEEFRALKALLDAHQYGYEMSVFEFTTKKKEGSV